MHADVASMCPAARSCTQQIPRWIRSTSIRRGRPDLAPILRHAGRRRNKNELGDGGSTIVSQHRHRHGLSGPEPDLAMPACPPIGSSLGPSSATRGSLLDKSGTRRGGKSKANLHHSGHARITARPARQKPAGGANMRLGMAGMLTWGNLGTFGCLISCILPDPDGLVIVSRILASHTKEHSRSGTAHATWVFIPCCPADCCLCPATSARYQSAGPGTE